MRRSIIAAAALAAALALAGCGSAAQTTTQATATTTARGAGPSGTSTSAARPSSPKPPSGPYGETAAEVFRTQCEVSGDGSVQSPSKCQCELSYIEAHVPWAQYVAEGPSIGIRTSAPVAGTPGSAGEWLLDTGPDADNPQWYLDAVAACPQP